MRVFIAQASENGECQLGSSGVRDVVYNTRGAATGLPVNRHPDIAIDPDDACRMRMPDGLDVYEPA